jgi:hypothetical protein
MQKWSVAVLDQPFRTGEIALPGPACSGRLAYGIDIEHQERCLIPLGSLSMGIEKSQVREQMLFIVVCQRA